MTNKHSLYSASSLDRLAVCPPSARLSEGIESVSGEAAQRGTRIHALAESMLTGGHFPIDFIEEEMRMAENYADFVDEILKDGDIYVELDVTLALQAYNINFGGTADAVIRHNDSIDVIDLKTGTQHISPKENKQLLTYALGALDTVGSIGVKTVRLHIWQPGNVGTVEYNVERIREWAKELIVIGNRADDPFEKAVPTKKSCYYCKGKVKCEALRDIAIESAKQEFAENTLEKLLDDVEIVSIWVDAIKEEGKKQLISGVNGGHWGLKAGSERSSWKDKEKAFEFF